MTKLAAAALLLAAACDYAPGGRCASSADCAAGEVCASGICAPGTPPPSNQAPAAAPDAYAGAADAILEVPKSSGVLLNDADPDGDPIAAERVARPSYGIVYLAPDGSFVYVPYSGFIGSDAFTYRASDGALRSEIVTVTLTVGP